MVDNKNIEGLRDFMLQKLRHSAVVASFLFSRRHTATGEYLFRYLVLKYVKISL